LIPRFDGAILSDISANTLLLHPDVWRRGERVANRINLLAKWTRNGGGLIMIGGYFSFQGIDSKARRHNTRVEDARPVTCLTCDDRLEIPEGCVPTVNAADHPILGGITGDWPYLLGVNEVVLKNKANVDLILSLPADQRGLPLLATGSYEKGRTVAATSYMSERWLPPAFLAWDGYDKLFGNMVAWAANDIYPPHKEAAPMDVIALTQRLMAFDTINPTGQ
jgi:uncharacterized membrane protein